MTQLCPGTATTKCMTQTFKSCEPDAYWSKSVPEESLLVRWLRRYADVKRDRIGRELQCVGFHVPVRGHAVSVDNEAPRCRQSTALRMGDRPSILALRKLNWSTTTPPYKDLRTGVRRVAQGRRHRSARIE